MKTFGKYYNISTHKRIQTVKKTVNDTIKFGKSLRLWGIESVVSRGNETFSFKLFKSLQAHTPHRLFGPVRHHTVVADNKSNNCYCYFYVFIPYHV